MTTLGIALALACAAMANLAMLCKHRAPARRPRSASQRRCAASGALFRSRWWTIGFAVAAVAWVLHVAAMAVAPLSLVQAVIAGGLVLIAYPAHPLLRPHGSAAASGSGLGLAAAGLAFLAVTVPHASENEGYSIATLAAFEAVIVGAGCALFASGHPAPRLDLPRRRPRPRLRPADRRLQRRDQGAHRGASTPAA